MKTRFSTGDKVHFFDKSANCSKNGIVRGYEKSKYVLEVEGLFVRRSVTGLVRGWDTDKDVPTFWVEHRIVKIDLD